MTIFIKTQKPFLILTNPNKNIIALHKSFEKLTKVVLIKIEKQQESDVIKILNEFDEIFSLFLDRKNNQRSEFIKVFVCDPPTPTIDFDIQKIESDFLQLYIETFIKIWKTSFAKQSYKISKTSLIIVNNRFKKYRTENLPPDNFDSIKAFYKCNQTFLEYFQFVISETSLKDDFQSIADFLYDYLEWIMQLEKLLLESYLKLLMNPVHSESTDKATITVNITLLNEPSSAGIQFFNDLFFNIWKNSFDKKLDNTAYNTVTIIENILTLLLSRGRRSKDYISIANYFIRLLQSINFEINKSPNKFSSSSAKATFIWFFNIVFKDDFDWKLIYDLQIPLFTSVRLTLIDKNKKQFVSFIEHIINGNYNPDYGMLPDFDFQLKYAQKDILNEYENAKTKLIRGGEKALTLQDFQKVKIAFDEFSITAKKFKNIDETVTLKIISEYDKYIAKEFKYKIVQQTVIWLGAYCLFLKQYDFIEELLFYNQPKDSPVSWGNKDINPLNIDDIFAYYHRRYELDSNVTFLWDGHHEFSTYYNTYLAILLMNAVNQNQRKGETGWNEYNPDFISLGKTIQEIESIAYSLNELKQIIVSLKNRMEIITGCGLSEQIANLTITLLENKISYIEKQKQELLINAEVNPTKEQNFINDVYEYYQKGGAIKNIVNLYNPISATNEPYPGKQFLNFGINEITMKSPLANNDEGMYYGFPEAFARKLAFNENMELKHIFIEKSKKSDTKIDQSMIVEELDKIGQLNDKILIFSNLYPSYEIFGSNSGFIQAHEISETERPKLHEFIGRFKGADVFKYGDETNWKQLLILKKHPESGIGSIKYYEPIGEPKEKIGEEKTKEPIEKVTGETTEELIKKVTKKTAEEPTEKTIEKTTEKTTDKITDFKIKDHFYWKLHNLNEEQKIIDNLIKEPPYWLLQQATDEHAQRTYLLQQINIIIRYKMNLELPPDFQGWFFYL